MKKLSPDLLRARVLRLLGSLSLTLPVALGCAAVFELWQGRGLEFWLRGLLFCLPLALSGAAVRRLRRLWQFSVASVALSVGAALLLGHPGGGAVLLLCCLLRGRARVFEELQPSLLETPTLWVELLYVAVFLTGAFLRAPLLERLAVLSAVLTLLIFFSHRGLSRLDRYLTLNRDVTGLPARRITRWAGGALLAALVLSMILLLPGALSVRGDLVLEVPQKTARSSSAYEEDFSDPMPASGAAALGEIFGGQEVREFHGEPLFFAVAILCGALALAALVRLLRSFRGAFHDPRDTVQTLGREEGEEAVFLQRPRRLSVLDRSPNGRIRRAYRRRVLRRKECCPVLWQTPSEIEESAALADPELHALYEKARYGPVPCTGEEARRLRAQRKA